ncbi:hypothetical protein [Prevotella pallens]|uniref:hypothetical protein n=1 Tax=Prevotella pallens TaxID=60133 RepID=UPI0028EAA78B|nr:hypothetical protein [Prevotella pallens]
MNTFMKTKITTLILLLLGLSSGTALAQITYYHYTDAEGLTWTFKLDGAGGATLCCDNNLNEQICVSGPSITISTETNPYLGTFQRYTYQGDELRIPSTVSDGTNTYPVRDIQDGFAYVFKAEKVVLPASLTGGPQIVFDRNMSKAFFHSNVRRVVAAPGCQLPFIGHLCFAWSLQEFPDPMEGTLYFDFSECPFVPVTPIDGDAFSQIFDNALFFTNAVSNQDYAGIRRKSTFTSTDNIVRAGVCATLHIDDEESFESPRTFTATQASYDRVFSNVAGKAVSTLYLPYPTDLPTGMRAYTLTSKGTDINGDKAFMFSPLPDGTRLQANTPYLVQITDGQSHTLPTMHNVTVPATPNIDNTAVVASNDGNWKFYGTTLKIRNDKAFAKKAYYLNGNKWWQVQSGVSTDYIAPFRCFISSPTGAVAAPSFFMVLEDDNTADGIKALETETNTDIKSGKYPFYSVDGKQMGNDYNKLESGQMYIVNGKKFYKI